jgi:DNA repair protein RecN (Recombination protein N)
VAITAAADLLDGDNAPTVASLLTDAIRSLPGEGALSDVVDRLHALRIDATDLAQTLGTLKPGVAPDSAELAVLDARAADLHQLARTFGGTLESALQERLRIQQDLERLESSTTRSREIADRVRELEAEIVAESARLRSERDQAAPKFTAAVQSHFASVALPRATLSASVEGEDGSAISLLFSSDNRRTPGPLQQLASGGELARVLLAISLESVSTNVVAVFDEIDAGIGGTVAEQIGECLRQLSERQQVIVVTHLASVAALADRHFVVEGVSESRLNATEREVTGGDRVGEIARMLAGESAPAAARALAEQLLTPSRP